MTDHFALLPLRKLLTVSLHSLKENKAFFGIDPRQFFVPDTADAFRMYRFNQLLESPIGVAAGPHTQLSQNIVAAWLTGARYMELKTVQTLDEIEVNKPCIDMQDEGYNCEWSQELKIRESFEQYLDAWIVLHILQHELGADTTNGPGFVFNMSVGYDLEGIMKPNVQWFLDKMQNAEEELKQKSDTIRDLYPRLNEVEISPCMTDNITLSTMHGCPPHEIRQIAEYLIRDRGLHTTVKLNPTLLGKTDLRAIIDNSGFETHVPDEAFEHDLKYEDALDIIKSLRADAEKKGVFFGLKLTNTLESQNNKDVFGDSVDMMYGSGKMLHPVSVNVARKLQNDFKGELDISFSGGADAFNTVDLLKCGLMPVTVSSDLLKPGGYARTAQYIENLRASDLHPNFWKCLDNKETTLLYLNDYADKVLQDAQYKRKGFSAPSIKTTKPLGIFDCAFAPCETTCPTNQNIPSYMYFTARGEFEKAYEVIQQTNPFPNTTGMVCDHTCESKCTRINYDDPLKIREIKRFVSEKHNEKELNSEFCAADSFRDNKKKCAAVIGAGPAGLSFAYFMAKAGFEVKVYEKKEKGGGMPRSVIPKFRLPDSSVDIDIAHIADEGIKILYEQTIDAALFEELKKTNDYLFIGVGAQKARALPILGANPSLLTDPLLFLENVKCDPDYTAGKQIAVIGGGNTAMDAARTAKRLVGNNGEVHILYRRTIDQMPADPDEIADALSEGIKVTELVSPKAIERGGANQKRLRMERMRLGEKDGDGRRRPVRIPDSEFTLDFDTIIPAVGQDLDIDFVSPDLLKSKVGKYETRIPNVFIGGDALRGAASLIKAVGDGRKAAQIIIDREKIEYDTQAKVKRELSNTRDLMKRKSFREFSVVHKTNSEPIGFNFAQPPLRKKDAVNEAKRCLLCDEVCNVCTTLCPNLALQSYCIQPFTVELQKVENGEIVHDKTLSVAQTEQIIHIPDFCNQCGNCNTFCPTSDAPYKVKPHFYLNKADFERERDGYYFDTESQTLFAKETGFDFFLKSEDKHWHFRSDDAEVFFDKADFQITQYTGADDANFGKAFEMRVVFEAVHSLEINV